MRVQRLLHTRGLARGLVVGAAVASIVFVAGCTETSGDTFGALGGPQATRSSTADRCAAAIKYGAAACHRIERCGHRTDDSVSMERCERGVAANVMTFLSGLGDPKRVSACADTLEGAPCGEAGQCEITMFDLDDFVEEGGACKTSSRCEGTLGCVEGACRERRGEGGACTEKGECKPGLSCQSGKCARVVDGVTSCESDLAACADGRSEPVLVGNAQAYGEPDTFFCAEDRICRKYVHDRPRGESCGENGRMCAPELVCDTETKRCIDPPSYGGSCEGVDACKSCVDFVCLDPLNECS